MCGGTLETVPCSRVGHIQRNYNKPYKNHTHGDYLSKNNKRVAEIWLDDKQYKNFFYFVNPNVRDAVLGDIADGLERRKRCRSFEWYLENVFNETGWPTRKTIFGKVSYIQAVPNKMLTRLTWVFYNISNTSTHIISIMN